MRFLQRSAPRTTILGLTLWYAFLSAWLFFAGVSHSLAHTHHNAATHADPLCMWLCTAGQAVATPDVPPIAPHELITYTGVRNTSAALSRLLLPVFSRGPPEHPFSS